MTVCPSRPDAPERNRRRAVIKAASRRFLGVAVGVRALAGVALALALLAACGGDGGGKRTQDDQDIDVVEFPEYDAVCFISRHDEGISCLPMKE